MSFYNFADCTEPFIVDIFTDGVADDAIGVAGGVNTIQSRGKSCLFLFNFYNDLLAHFFKESVWTTPRYPAVRHERIEQEGALDFAPWVSL